MEIIYQRFSFLDPIRHKFRGDLCYFSNIHVVLLLEYWYCFSFFTTGASVGICGDPGIPPHGSRLGGEEFKTKSLLRFSCEAGYSLIGSAERTCLHNGTWSGTQPVCQGGSCMLTLLLLLSDRTALKRLLESPYESAVHLALQTAYRTAFISLTQSLIR